MLSERGNTVGKFVIGKVKTTIDEILEGNDYRKNVLVVDDNAMMLHSVQRLLEPQYKVTIAQSGMEAMKELGRKKPDIILLDYEMPVCDGKMTFEMIRADKDLCDIPVIFITGVDDRAHIAAVLSLRPAGYILKPAAPEKIISTIEKALS